MPTALVLGASRGLGLVFVQQYRAQGWEVIATHRNPADGPRLAQLGARCLQVDLLQLAQVAGLGWQLEGEPLDVAVVNAGIYGPRATNVGQPPSQEDFDQVMHTNVLAPMRLLPLLPPLLQARAGTLAFVSSRMGSIGLTQASNGILYRSSKAALNMVARLAHNEWSARGVRVLSLHPGWVRTDMGGQGADIDAQESVAGMRRLIADPQAFPSGGFHDYQGRQLAW